MIDYDILKRFGTTDARIREVMTCPCGSPDHKFRKELENRIESRAFQGAVFNMRSYQVYAASDLAWDGHVITKEVIPLIQYAQGKISAKSCDRQLQRLSPETRKQFCDFNEKGEVIDIRVQDFCKVWVNLVRSFVTRRRAAMTVRYTSQVPFLKYEPVSTSYTAQLKADVLSQRVEMIVNQQNYRHEFDQIALEELLYGHTVAFPSCGWEKEYSYRKAELAEGLSSTDNFKIEQFIEREGFGLTRPHPTRVFADNSAALASINTDSGCEYIGFWNVVRYRDIYKNTKYFNRESVNYNTAWSELFESNLPYFELYFADAAIKFPSPGAGGADVAGRNDRLNNIGTYTGELQDSSVVLTEYREKLVPRDNGFGDYPFPVWVRFVVAGANTVIFAEILPSTPAFYFGYNENDNRHINTAFAHEIMPWQDQASNLLTQLLYTQKSGLIKLLSLNTDLMTEDQLKAFRAIIDGDDYYSKPIVIEYSGVKQASELGLAATNMLNIEETDNQDDVTLFFSSLLRIIELAERVLNFSPQELGQPAPREISATESSMIENTTNSIYDFLGIGLNEGLAALKKCLYEGLIARGSEEVYVPAANRYSADTVKNAGFEFRNEDAGDEENTNIADTRRLNLLGDKQSLVYEYIFSGRATSDRPSSARTAEVMVQLLAQLVQIPGLLQDMGKTQLHKMLNAIVRASGIGIDVMFEMSEGDSDTLPDPNQVADRDQIKDAFTQIAERIGATEQQVKALTDLIQQSAGQSAPAGAEVVAPPPEAQGAPAAPPTTLSEIGAQQAV